MQAPEDQLKRINEKFQLVARQYQQLQKENERLKEERIQHASRIQSLTAEMEKHRQQAAANHLSGSGMDAEERRTLEKRLSQYVREIDRCITILND